MMLYYNTLAFVLTAFGIGVDASAILRINCGARTDMLLGGKSWGEDEYFFGGDKVEDNDKPHIWGAGDLSKLFWTERVEEDGGDFKYRLPAVEDGYYEVVLYFSEPAFHHPGHRIFDIVINDEEVENNYDIVYWAGGKDTMVKETYLTSADNGSVDIEFKSVKDSAKVNAIELYYDSSFWNDGHYDNDSGYNDLDHNHDDQNQNEYNYYDYCDDSYACYYDYDYCDYCYCNYGYWHNDDWCWL